MWRKCLQGATNCTSTVFCNISRRPIYITLTCRLRHFPTDLKPPTQQTSTYPLNGPQVRRSSCTPRIGPYTLRFCERRADRIGALRSMPRCQPGTDLDIKLAISRAEREPVAWLRSQWNSFAGKKGSLILFRINWKGFLGRLLRRSLTLGKRMF